MRETSLNDPAPHTSSLVRLGLIVGLGSLAFVWPPFAIARLLIVLARTPSVYRRISARIPRTARRRRLLQPTFVGQGALCAAAALVSILAFSLLGITIIQSLQGTGWSILFGSPTEAAFVIWAASLPVCLALDHLTAALQATQQTAAGPSIAHARDRRRSARRDYDVEQAVLHDELDETGIGIGTTVLPVALQQPDDREVLHLPWEVLNLHLVVVGATGSGKTTLLARIIQGVLARGERIQVFVLSGKRDQHDLEQLVGTFSQYHPSKTPLMTSVGGLALWRAEAATQRETLVSMIGTESTGDTRVYHQRDVAAMKWLVPDSAALTTLTDLRARVAAKMEDRRHEHYSSIAKLDSVLGRVRILDGSRGVDDSELVCCSLVGPPDAKNDQAKMVLGDLLDYLTRRKPAHQRAVIVFDEVTNNGDAVTPQLIAQIRSTGTAVLISVHDYAGLGANEDDRQEILSNLSTFIVMRTNNPDEFLKAGGHNLSRTRTVHFSGPNPQPSITETKDWAVDRNRVLRLGVGEALLIRGGYHAFFRAAPPTHAPKKLPKPTERVSEPQPEASFSSEYDPEFPDKL